MKKHTAEVGKKYGKLTITKKLESFRTEKGKLYVMVECLCDCGNIKAIKFQSLVSGGSISCGCVHKEIATKLGTTHGLHRHPLYKIRIAVLSRCYNKNNLKYKHYGGRGISVCKEWVEYPAAFIHWGIENGWKDGLEIDRIDNNGNYCPQNCRYVDRATNMRNTSRNIIIDYMGEQMCLTDCAKASNIPFTTLKNRISRWDKEDWFIPIRKPTDKKYKLLKATGVLGQMGNVRI